MNPEKYLPLQQGSCSGFTGYAGVIGAVLRDLLIAVLYSCHYLKLYESCWPSHHYSVDIFQTLLHVPAVSLLAYADVIRAVLRELLIAHLLWQPVRPGISNFVRHYVNY